MPQGQHNKLACIMQQLQHTKPHAARAGCSLLLAGVRLVVEAVCVVMGVKPAHVKDAQFVECVDSYVAAGQKMLADDDFLRSLR